MHIEEDKKKINNLYRIALILILFASLMITSIILDGTLKTIEELKGVYDYVSYELMHAIRTTQAIAAALFFMIFGIIAGIIYNIYHWTK